MDIEQRALELVNDICGERSEHFAGFIRRTNSIHEALCRAIEAQDAEREAQDAFRQEVSEFALGVKEYMASVGALTWQQDCDRFIIQPKADPLQEIIAAAVERCTSGDKLHEAVADELKSRGLEIREVGE